MNIMKLCRRCDFKVTKSFVSLQKPLFTNKATLLLVTIDLEISSTLSSIEQGAELHSHIANDAEMHSERAVANLRP